MSDFKSKLPDLKELGSMSNKLFQGIKNSVADIVQDYKQKRAEEELKPKTDDVVMKAAQPTQEKRTVSSVSSEDTPKESPGGTSVNSEPVIKPVKKPTAPEADKG